MGDLWSIFDFINPGLLGNAKQFSRYAKGLADRTENPYGPLRELVRPYILRRMKTDKSVIADLPDKTEIKALCGLSRRQTALYGQAVADLEKSLEDADGIQRKGVVLAMLTRLKQICCGLAKICLDQSGDGSSESIRRDIGNVGNYRLTPVALNLMAYREGGRSAGMIGEGNRHFENLYRSVGRRQLSDIHNPHHQRIRSKGDVGICGYQVGSLREYEGILAGFSQRFSSLRECVSVYPSIVHFSELSAHYGELPPHRQYIETSYDGQNDSKDSYDYGSPSRQLVMFEIEEQSERRKDDAKSLLYVFGGSICEVYALLGVVMIIERRGDIPHVIRWVIAIILIESIGGWLIHRGYTLFVENVSQNVLTLPAYWSTLSISRSDMANVLNMDKQIMVIGALAEGSSIRSIERMTGVHRDTVMRLGVKVGQGCTALMDATMRNLPCTRLEMDEIWGFIGKKDKHVRIDDDPTLGNVWTFCAIDADTKLVPAFKCGDRDAATAKAFVADVASPDGLSSANLYRWP